MEDFSQTGEQAAIIEALQFPIEIKPPGRFLDIGAWHPLTFSNTRVLWEVGWSGIFIEPSPGPVRTLVEEYGRSDRAIVIAAAVGVAGGLLEMEVTDDAVSMAAADEQRMATWQYGGGFYGRLTVPVIALGDLFTRYGGDFEMVSIDTEGTSGELFIELLRLGPRPRVICVEHDNRVIELNQYAQAAQYRQVHINGNNIIFQWQSGL